MHSVAVEFNKKQRKSTSFDLRPGDVVKIQRKVIEGGKQRIQIFEGMIIGVKGRQSSSPMITVRKVSQGVGVELILPVYSPSIAKIEVIKRAKVRQSKLYYVREKSTKSLKFKYRDLSKNSKEKEEIAIPETNQEQKEKTEEEPKSAE